MPAAPITKSQFELCGATMMTALATSGTAPAKRHPAAPRTARPRARPAAQPRRGTAGPISGSAKADTSPPV